MRLTNRHITTARALFLMATLLNAPAHAQDTKIAPWHWSGDALEAEIGAVRAGKSLKPNSWPNDANIAVMFSFAVDLEAAHVVGMHENPGPGQYAEGEYGARAGLTRIMAALEKHQIPASFFIPAINFTSHPQIIGRRSRILILEELLSYISEHEDVWFATHGQVAAFLSKDLQKD